MLRKRAVIADIREIKEKSYCGFVYKCKKSESDLSPVENEDDCYEEDGHCILKHNDCIYCKVEGYVCLYPANIAYPEIGDYVVTELLPDTNDIVMYTLPQRECLNLFNTEVEKDLQCKKWLVVVWKKGTLYIKKHIVMADSAGQAEQMFLGMGESNHIIMGLLPLL